MKVAIGVPSGDTVHADFAFSLSRMVLSTAKNTKIEIEQFISAKSSIIQKGRHSLVEAALLTKADYILMLDSDMTFPEDLLQVLVSKNKDIIGCNYGTRRVPFKQLVKTLTKEYYPEKKDGVEEVGYLPTGVILIKLDVFRKFVKPYFDVVWNGEDFNGEDYNFCDRARNLGFKVFCDFTLSKYIGHIGTAIVRL